MRQRLTMTEPAITDPYRVKPGDTLSSIARRCGKTVRELQRWNGLRDPNKLAVGQTLYLSESSAFGVTALFLDALRHPIENLPFMLKFDGRTVTGRTGANGMTARQVTQSAHSDVEVWVQTVEGTWQQVTRTLSGYGHKLLTLVSGSIVVPGNTEPLPQGAPAKPSAPAPAKPAPGVPQPPLPKPASGTPSKNNPAVKTRKTKGPQGQPVLKIEVDIPQGLAALFGNYQGGEITEAQWEQAAAYLQCEAAVLKAFAEVESGGHLSFWRLNHADGANIPAVLFERHYFSRLTGGKHDKTHPDISWPTGYRKKSRLGKSDKKMHDGRVDADDIYGDYASAYLRLINAYRLDAQAALKSCSWGKFQIMGNNFALCRADDVETFAASMCTSEFAQLRLLCGYIRNKPGTRIKALGIEMSLWGAVKAKNWQAIAFHYNGPDYKTYGYDSKLQAAYEKYRKKA